MFGAFLWQERRMAAAANRPDASLAEMVGQKIASLGLAGHHGDTDHISRFIEAQRFESFLNDLNFIEPGGSQSGYQGQIKMMSVFGSFESLNQQSFRRDKQQL